MQTAPSQSSDVTDIFMQQVKTPLGSPAAQKLMHQSRFADIPRSLWGDQTLCITINVPLVLATSLGLLAGTTMATMMFMWLWQDIMMGTTYVDTVTASMSLISLGPTPMAGDHPMATLEDVTEWKSEA